MSLVPLSQLEFLGLSCSSQSEHFWVSIGDDVENNWQWLYERLLFCPIAKYLRRLHFCISSIFPPSEEILLRAHYYLKYRWQSRSSRW